MMETKLISVQRSHGRATLVLSTGETLVMPRAMLKERPYRGGTPFDREAFDSFLLERSYPRTPCARTPIQSGRLPA